MCAPVLGILGAVVSAVGSIAAGQAQANAANAQAAAYRQQAEAERQMAEFNASRQQDKSIKLIAEQRGGLLSNGIAMSGSALDLLERTTTETEMDVAAIKYNGEIKARNFEAQAAVYDAKADGAQTAGIFGAITPVIKAFGGGDFGGSSFGAQSAGTNLELTG